MFYLQADYEQAEPLFRQAYTGNREAHGATHWRTTEVLERFAASLIELNRPDEAAALLEESLNDAFKANADREKLAPKVAERIGLLDRCGAGKVADRFRTLLEDAGPEHALAKP